MPTGAAAPRAEYGSRRQEHYYADPSDGDLCFPWPAGGLAAQENMCLSYTNVHGQTAFHVAGRVKRVATSSENREVRPGRTRLGQALSIRVCVRRSSAGCLRPTTTRSSLRMTPLAGARTVPRALVSAIDH